MSEHKKHMDVDTAKRIMGLSGDVTQDTINSAHRKAISKYHPDLFHNDEDKKRAEAKMAICNEAAQVLKRSISEENREKKNPDARMRSNAGDVRDWEPESEYTESNKTQRDYDDDYYYDDDDNNDWRHKQRNKNFDDNDEYDPWNKDYAFDAIMRNQDEVHRRREKKARAEMNDNGRTKTAIALTTIIWIIVWALVLFSTITSGSSSLLEMFSGITLPVIMLCITPLITMIAKKIIEFITR